MYGINTNKVGFFSKKVKEGEVDAMPLPLLDLLPNMV
jgi:hypothetical protein